MAIRPEYEDIEFYFQQIRKYGLNSEREKVLMNEFNNYPILRQIVADMKKQGANNGQIINYIYKNFEEISDARKSKWKDGDYIKVGRPKKDPSEKAQRKKADRYKTIKDIKSSGTIRVDDLKKINYNDIRNFNTKEAQRIAYFLQERIKRDIRALHKAGLAGENSERYFKQYGGYLKDIRTASSNQLKAFIRRGVAFLRRETSTPAGVKRMRRKVAKAIKEAVPHLNIDKIAEKPDSYKLFWNSVHAAVDAGYGTLLGKEKYLIMETVELYMEGYDIDNEDLKDLLDNFLMDKLSLDSEEELRQYLGANFKQQYEIDEFE